jgi:Dolichyl-phosphate-mannose-protein mannosyltransferase
MTMARRWGLPAVAIAGAALGLGLRIWILYSPQGTLDSDEAVVGLMTRGILHGRFPIFFPGQGYGGSQEAFLTAPLMAIFGMNANTIRIVPITLWAASALLVWRIGIRLLDERRAVLAAVLFWVWPTYFAWKSSRFHGFYSSELFLGLAVLLLVLRLKERRSRRDLVLLGLALGCGLWASPQVALIALPALGWLVWSRRALIRDWRLVLAATLTGALPWLVGNIRHHWYSLHPGANEGPWLNHVHNLVVATLPEALGLRLAWSYEWLGGVAVGVVLYALLVAGLVWLLWRRPARLAPLLLIVLVFPVFYFVSPYTWLESEPRYLTLVMPVFALLIAYAMKNLWRTAAILGIAVALSVGGMVELQRHHVAAFRTEGTAMPSSIGPVLQTLRQNDIHYAFASYWVAWRITFESNEKIIAAKASYGHPSVVDGRVQPGDPPNDRGFWPGYYARVDTHRQIAQVFVVGGTVEPTIRPFLLRAGYTRIVNGKFAIWLPPTT